MIVKGDAPTVELVALSTFSGVEGFIRRNERFTTTRNRAFVLIRKQLAAPAPPPRTRRRRRRTVQGVVPGPAQVQAAPEPEEVKVEQGGVSAKWICVVDGCGQEFRTRGWLKRHQREAHPEVVKGEEGGLFQEG